MVTTRYQSMRPQMSKSSQLLQDLIALCPDFVETWTNYGDLYVDETGEATPCGVFSVFTFYVVDVLTSKHKVDLQKAFDFVESKMLDDEEMSTAAATCLLENLMNRVPETLEPLSF